MVKQRSHAEYASRYYFKNKEEISKRRKEYVRNNQEKVKTQYAARYLRNRTKVREQQREYWLKSKYGITGKQWSQIFTYQGNKCGICQTSRVDLDKRNWCVDHGHVTGDVRGILCNSCNLLLGYSKDNEVVLQRAILYLQRGPL